MAEADVWKYRAYIIPTLNKPIAQGDIATVVAAITRLLRDHPAYRISLRSVTHGRVESRHAVHLRTGVDGQMLVTSRPADGVRGDSERLAHDLAEVLAVLTNLGISTRNPGEF